MNTNVEELLTRELHRQAETTQWRPELLRGALRRHRRRRIRSRVALPVLSVAVAAAVAVSVVAVASGRSAPASARPKAETVAYVLGRARSAVSAAGSDVLEVRSRLSNGWSFTSWYGPARGLIMLDSHPSRGAVTTYYVGPQKTVIVDYGTKTWWSWKLGSVAAKLPPKFRHRFAVRRDMRMLPGLEAFELTVLGGGVRGLTIPTPKVIRSELAQGRFRLVGRQTGGGQQLLELRATERRNPLLAGPGRRALIIWVNAKTYLPVRSVAPSTYASSMVSQFTWLAPTAPNLAILNPRIPAGFTHRGPHCPCG
jgi:hypothetical protein